MSTEADNPLARITDEALKDRARSLHARIEARQAEQWADRAELGPIKAELRRREGPERRNPGEP
jgi:hypothetical protein